MIDPREQAAFLRAICETPEDDVVRLVYADWLEEHGQPERAEFIRVQIELAKRGYPGPLSHQAAALAIADVAKMEPRVGRSVAILYAHGADWLGDPFILIEPQYVGQWAWSRGFLHSIVCLTIDFLRYAGRIFAAQPVTAVSLPDRAPAIYVDAQSHVWRWWRGIRAEGDNADPWTLAPKLFDCVPHRHARYVRDRHHEYERLADADTALLEACLIFGRKAAGQPERIAA